MSELKAITPEVLRNRDKEFSRYLGAGIVIDLGRTANKELGQALARIAELETDLEEFRADGEEDRIRAENAEARLGRFVTDEDPKYVSEGDVPLCIECGDPVTSCENPPYCAEVVALRRGRLADRKRAEKAEADLKLAQSSLNIFLNLRKHEIGARLFKAEAERDKALEVCGDLVNAWDEAEANQWKNSLALGSPLTMVYKRAKALLAPPDPTPEVEG